MWCWNVTNTLSISVVGLGNPNKVSLLFENQVLMFDRAKKCPETQDTAI